MTRERESLTPALAGSALLHAGLAAILLISWPWSRELKVGTVVPVTIVANAPTTDVRPAMEAPEPQFAATPEPEPLTPLQPPAPTPAPEPPAPRPTSVAKPTPAPKALPNQAVAKPTPTPVAKPAQPAPTAKPMPRQEVDLDKLLASVSKSAKAGGGAPKSAAPKGPAPRPETAAQARPAVGAGLSAAAVAGLSDELQRRWNPNCEVDGGREVRLRVTFTIGTNGQVTGDVSAGGDERSANAVVQAAAERAIRAVYAASPFRSLPPEFYGQRVAVRFNAREACS